jgi:hypothetical protein
MHLYQTIAAAALLACIAGHVEAKPLAARDLIADCTSKAKGNDVIIGHVYCNGFVGGLASGLAVQAEAFPDTAYVCIPHEIQAIDAVDVAVKFWRENPKFHGTTASDFLMTAFLDAWPCEHSTDNKQAKAKESF